MSIPLHVWYLKNLAKPVEKDCYFIFVMDDLIYKDTFSEQNVFTLENTGNTMYKYINGSHKKIQRSLKGALSYKCFETHTVYTHIIVC